MISGFFGLAFLATLHLRPYPLAYMVKTIPIVWLSYFAFISIKGNKGKLLSLGLLFSAIGDVLLEYPKPGLFLHGLGSFLVAHLFYILVFLRKISFSMPRVLGLIGLIAVGIFLANLLIPVLGEMRVPVLVYLGIILLMAISATLGSENHLLTILGACLFIISDSIIAINRFLTPVYLSSLWIMSTYYAAQYLITIGVSRDKTIA